MKLSRFDAMVVTLLGIEMVSGDSSASPSLVQVKSADTSVGITKILKDLGTARQSSATAVDKAMVSVKEADAKAGTTPPDTVKKAKAALDAATSAIEQSRLKIDTAVILAFMADGKADKTATDAIKQASDSKKSVDPEGSSIEGVATTADAVEKDSHPSADAKHAIKSAATDINDAAKKLIASITELEKIDPAIKATGSSTPSGSPDGKGSIISSSQAIAVQTMQKEYLNSQGLGPVTVACAMALDDGRIELPAMGFDEGVLQSDRLRSALIPHRPSQASTITPKVSVKGWEVHMG